MTGATWGWGRERGAAAQLSWARGKDLQQLAVLGLCPPIPNPTCSAGEAKGGDTARVSPAAVLGTSPCPVPQGGEEGSESQAWLLAHVAAFIAWNKCPAV